MRTGGCHCGAIRYEVDGEPIVHALCHCTDCRRHAGAPMVGWTMYPKGALKLTKGVPKTYKSSENGRRQFCPDCGTALAMRVDYEPGQIDVSLPTLDQPEGAPPEFHIFTASRIPWFEVRDALPRFEAGRTLHDR